MKRILTAILAMLGLGTATAADSPPSAAHVQDYSHVTSRELALKLVAEGKLFKILLFPAEFGGEDVAANVVYVPVGIPELKDQITGTLVRFYKEGLIDNLKVRPEYKGDSFVPSKIHFKASHSEKKGVFEPTIDVW